MKKLLLGATIGALLFTGCIDNRPMSNDGKGSQRSTMQGSNMLYDPDYYYEIDTWGTNADVWEFTPKSNPNYACVNVGASSRSVFCFPKAK